MRPWPIRHVRTTTVTVQPRSDGATDVHGNTVSTWGPPRTVTGCVLAPASSTEPTEAGRDAVITTMTLYAPPGTVIGPLDCVITEDGTVWDVFGQPAAWPANPITGSAPPGVVVTIRRSEG